MENKPRDSASAPGTDVWQHIATSLAAESRIGQRESAEALDRDPTGPGQVSYHGYPQRDRNLVIVVDPQSAPRGRPLHHYVRHSPAGLDWGYAGNGPRDLARSLLADALGDPAVCPACRDRTIGWPGTGTSADRAIVDTHPRLACPNRCDHGLLPLPYLQFTEQVVATRLRYGKAWSLDRITILDWLSQRDETTTAPILTASTDRQATAHRHRASQARKPCRTQSWPERRGT